MQENIAYIRQSGRTLSETLSKRELRTPGFPFFYFMPFYLLDLWYSTETLEAPVHSEVISQTGNGKRGRGRSYLTWKKSMKRDLKDWSITKELVWDRRKWKLAIHVSKSWSLISHLLLSFYVFSFYLPFLCFRFFYYLFSLFLFCLLSSFLFPLLFHFYGFHR
jgi:hypothetical protein